MLKLTFPADPLRRQVKDTRRRLVGERAKLLDRLGRQAEHIAIESYEKRAGGSPDAGITWQPLTPSYLKSKLRRGLSEKIGVATGRLEKSAEYRTTGRSVEVIFAAPYAEDFFRLRPLVPNNLPKPWEAALEREAIDWADSILVTNFSKDI